jgi:anaphase-promoting complex subunit 5
MSRYLTPSKIALLCLVAVYTEGVVPNSAIIPVLSFLASHLLPLDPSRSSNQVTSQDKNHTISINDFEKATSSLESSIPGRTVWDLFLKKIWLIDCADSLEEFFSTISNILVKTREEQHIDRNNGILPKPGRIYLSRSSPLGTFVRRAQLEYTRLQFHDSVALWRRFIRYRIPTYHAWIKRNPLDIQAAVDINMIELGLDLTSPLAKVVYGDLGDDSHDEGGISTKDIERLLEFQVGEMQSSPPRFCFTPSVSNQFGQAEAVGFQMT